MRQSSRFYDKKNAFSENIFFFPYLICLNTGVNACMDAALPIFVEFN